MRWINLVIYVSNWWVYIFHKLKIQRRAEYIFELRGGLKAIVPTHLLFTFKEVFFRGVYTLHLSKQLPNNPVILDVGANAGYFSLAMLQKFPKAKVIAFEPFENNYALLEKHIQLNGLSNLTLDKRAVYGQSTTLSLSFSQDSGEFTTNASLWNIHQDSFEVESINLPDIFKHYQLSEIHLLKMDCEGAEYSILYDCPDEILLKIKQIVMEVHTGKDENEHIQALSNYLGQKGFQTKIIQNEFIWASR